MNLFHSTKTNFIHIKEKLSFFIFCFAVAFARRAFAAQMRCLIELAIEQTSAISNPSGVSFDETWLFNLSYSPTSKASVTSICISGIDSLRTNAHKVLSYQSENGMSIVFCLQTGEIEIDEALYQKSCRLSPEIRF